MNNTEQIFCVITVGNHQPRMLISLQQLADFFFRRVEIDMLNIVARRHNAADGTLVKIKYPLNHPPFLRIKDLLVTMIHQHGRGFGVQFRIFFLPAKQAHYRFGSPLAQRLISGKKTSPVKDSQLIERLDHHRETNGSVQVAFRNDEAETFCHQAKANHQQEA